MNPDERRIFKSIKLGREARALEFLEDRAIEERYL